MAATRNSRPSGLPYCYPSILPYSFLLLLLIFPLSYATYSPIIGIDFGAYDRNGRVEILANSNGNRLTPSYVSFTSGNKRVVGEDAKKLAESDPVNTIFAVKLLFGRNYADEEVQANAKIWPFKVVEREFKPIIEVRVDGNDKLVAPEEIAAAVFGQLKEVADEYLGTNATRAVLTVPDHFNDVQRQATKAAAELAGLTCEAILNESTAAAFAHGLDKLSPDRERRVLVCNLAGRSLDVNVVLIKDGSCDTVATGGGHLYLEPGGVVSRVVDHLLARWTRKVKLDCRPDASAIASLRRYSENTLRAVSTWRDWARITIPSFCNEHNLSEVLTSNEVDEIIADLLSLISQHIDQVLSEAGVDRSEIDDLLVVGNSAFPQIVDYIERLGFDKARVPTGPLAEIVAYGAAIYAHDIPPEPEPHVECCARVAYSTVGIEAPGGVMVPVLPINSYLPARRQATLTTEVDNQSSFVVRIFECLPNHNKLIGEFTLIDFAPGPRGQQVEVTMAMAFDYTLNVTAVAKDTRSVSLIISPPVDHGRHETEAAVARYNQMEEGHKATYKAIAVWNELESYAYRARNELWEKVPFGTVLSDEGRERIAASAQKALDWLPTACRTPPRSFPKRLSRWGSSRLLSEKD
ncbi:ATPase with role in protein import into the ER [Geranomyces variabilis]|nr:ATPase with role in protein import into the ER [Geranomyces variabilis]